MKSILKQLTSTNVAKELGKNATKEQLSRLELLRKVCNKVTDILMEMMQTNDSDKVWNRCAVMATKGQLCREALEASN
jgi:hypothetical protein